MRSLLFLAFMLIASVGFSQTCGTKTQAGTECSRKVLHQGEKCWQHGGQSKAQKAGTSTVVLSPCGATTKAGTPCRNNVKGGGKCHLHKS
jgi:hypothetical protein